MWRSSAAVPGTNWTPSSDDDPLKQREIGDYDPAVSMVGTYRTNALDESRRFHQPACLAVFMPANGVEHFLRLCPCAAISAPVRSGMQGQPRKRNMLRRSEVNAVRNKTCDFCRMQWPVDTGREARKGKRESQAQNVSACDMPTRSSGLCCS